MNELLGAFEISATGLRAQRVRMDILANNIANANTTRTEEGGPFRRQLIVLLGRNISRDFRSGGVEIAGVEDDPSPFKMIYDPGHPDADARGYVSMPNIQIPIEMVDMIAASRAYEANVAAISAAKAMANRALDILSE